jgi:type II secretory ATPase GspE/PulE/Tfp pilus assembly ATPase PilB-like protein
MPEYLYNSICEDITKPNGIIIVTGPTGSGKTTTLYSCLRRINKEGTKLLTAEEPVEYDIEGIVQVPINPITGNTFPKVLRAFLRQDPDVIMVGEIRDLETAQIAVQASLTGHLVFSTLHTNDAAGAVTRLVDMGMENFLVSSALSGVLSQRLVRKICPVCKGSGNDGSGKCRRCNGSGYKGRTGIYELLLLSDELRMAVNRNASSSELEAIARKDGMITLREDGEEKVRLGITTQEELNRSAAEV